MKTLRETMLVSLLVLSLLVVPVVVYAKDKDRDDHDQRQHSLLHGPGAQIAALQAQVAWLTNQLSQLNLSQTQTAILDLQARVRALELSNQALQASVNSLMLANLPARVTALEQGGGGGGGLDLSKYVTIDTNTINGLAGPHLIFTGVNVHIRSGSGFTDDNVNGGGMLTGLGNLVVGYNEGGPAQRGGSHNIVGGTFNLFPSFGGLVVGRQNTISNQYATVTGGYQNEASGALSSILGGRANVTTGLFEHVP